MTTPLGTLVPAFCLVLSVSACDESVIGDAGDTDATTSDSAAGDTIDEGSAPDVAEDTAETGRDAGDVAADPDGDGSDDGSGDPEGCRSNSDCPARTDCVDGACLRRCVRGVECDDLNPCTGDVCASGHCLAEALDPPPALGDTTTGDCKALECVDGVPQPVAAEGDVPADDGISCTVEVCEGQYGFNRATDDLCDDGDDTNGAEVCRPSEGGCVNGESESCEALLPGWGPDELCGNGQDDDNDGLADEGCTCEFGAAQRCYTGPPNSRAVGGCLDGYQRCQNRTAPEWTDCEGEILPETEICDAKDNDCNLCVDDIEDCDPLLTCPAEDFARPLRFYPLDAGAIIDTGDATIESVQWRVIVPANSATVGVDDPDAVETRLYLDVSGDYQVSLQVDTDKGLFGCSWVVHVAGSGLRVEMRWDTFGAVDMDLHLHRSGRTTGFCTGDDCYYANCTTGGFAGGPEWGYPDSPAGECGDGAGPCNNPRLDIDNIRGFDPENINIDNPNDGDTFRVMAHKFSGGLRTNPVLSIYCGGRLRAVFGEAPDEALLTEAGGGCMGNTWRVADVRMIVDTRTGYTDCTVIPLSGTGASGYDIRSGTGAY